jgi:cellulose synthase/poly-beta-1,6-N-acetylglucosamine synthase-like glycosyltransferase
LAVDWIGIIFTMLSVTVTLIYSYYVYFGIIGFMKHKPSPEVQPRKSFAILLPAYKEESVVGETIRNLKALDYPKELYDIYVVIDTPDDMTGPAAEKEGAKILVRNNTKDAGRGYAVKWGLEEVRRRKDYDAYIIMDADNSLSENYLAKMNNELVAGHGIIQGNIRSKNPKENWVTRTIHVDYATRNRFVKQPRQDHRLCVFMEPGICISREVLDKVPFDAVTISEDIEYTSKLSCAGVHIRWIYDADIFEEKPSSINIAIRQRHKWMLGHTIVLKRYTGKLFWRALRKGDTIAWDCATYILVPALMVVYFFFFLAYILSGSNFTLLALLPRGSVDPTLIWISTVVNTLVGFWWIAVPLYALYLEKERVREYWYTPFTMMILFGIQLLLFIAVIFKRDKKTYWHTPHATSPANEPAKNAPATDPPNSQESSK